METRLGGLAMHAINALHSGVARMGNAIHALMGTE